MFKLYTGFDLPPESEFSDGDDFDAPKPYEAFQPDTTPVWDCSIPCKFEHDTNLVGALTYEHIDSEGDEPMETEVEYAPVSPTYEQYLAACEQGLIHPRPETPIGPGVKRSHEDGTKADTTNVEAVPVAQEGTNTAMPDLTIPINIGNGRKKYAMRASKRAVFKAFRASRSYAQLAQKGLQPVDLDASVAVKRTDDTRILVVEYDNIHCMIGIGRSGVDLFDAPIQLEDMSCVEVHGVIMNFDTRPDNPEDYGRRVIGFLMAGAESRSWDK